MTKEKKQKQREKKDIQLPPPWRKWEVRGESYAQFYTFEIYEPPPNPQKVAHSFILDGRSVYGSGYVLSIEYYSHNDPSQLIYRWNRQPTAKEVQDALILFRLGLTGGLDTTI